MTTGPALACPRHLLCIVQPGTTSPEVARTTKPVAIPDVRSVHLAPDHHLTFGDAPAKLDPGEVEMPWIWRVLREQVHARLPSYEQQRFNIVLSPVVVTTPSDTIPGVGVAGDF